MGMSSMPCRFTQNYDKLVPTMFLKRTPLRRKTSLKRNTPINKVGRVTKYRADRKKQWVRDHPPDEDGNYICHLCLKPVHISIFKLEHVLPKGSTPKAIAEADDNLGPSHKFCNNEKGSQRI